MSVNHSAGPGSMIGISSASVICKFDLSKRCFSELIIIIIMIIYYYHYHYYYALHKSHTTHENQLYLKSYNAGFYVVMRSNSAHQILFSDEMKPFTKTLRKTDHLPEHFGKLSSF